VTEGGLEADATADVAARRPPSTARRPLAGGAEESLRPSAHPPQTRRRPVGVQGHRRCPDGRRRPSTAAAAVALHAPPPLPPQRTASHEQCRVAVAPWPPHVAAVATPQRVGVAPPRGVAPPPRPLRRREPQRRKRGGVARCPLRLCAAAAARRRRRRRVSPTHPCGRAAADRDENTARRFHGHTRLRRPRRCRPLRPHATASAGATTAGTVAAVKTPPPPAVSAPAACAGQPREGGRQHPCLPPAAGASRPPPVGVVSGTAPAATCGRRRPLWETKTHDTGAPTVIEPPVGIRSWRAGGRGKRTPLLKAKPAKAARRPPSPSLPWSYRPPRTSNRPLVTCTPKRGRRSWTRRRRLPRRRRTFTATTPALPVPHACRSRRSGGGGHPLAAHRRRHLSHSIAPPRTWLLPVAPHAVPPATDAAAAPPLPGACVAGHHVRHCDWAAAPSRRGTLAATAWASGAVTPHPTKSVAVGASRGLLSHVEWIGAGSAQKGCTTTWSEQKGLGMRGGGRVGASRRERNWGTGGWPGEQGGCTREGAGRARQGLRRRDVQPLSPKSRTATVP